MPCLKEKGEVVWVKNGPSVNVCVGTDLCTVLSKLTDTAFSLVWGSDGTDMILFVHS